MRFQTLKASLVLDVPNSNGFIIGAADDVVAARMPADATHPVVVADQREQADAHRHVPDLDRAIPRTADQIQARPTAGAAAGVVVAVQTALLQRLRVAVRDRLGHRVQRRVRCPGDALDRVVVLLHDDLLFVGGQHVVVRVHRPDDDCEIFGTTSQQGAVRTDAHHSHPLLVAEVGTNAVAAGHLPQFDGLVARTRHDVIAGRQEGDRAHVVIVTVQRAQTGVGLEIPELYGQIGRAGD